MNTYIRGRLWPALGLWGITLFAVLAAAMSQATEAAKPAAPKADDPHLLLWLDAADSGTVRIDADGQVSGWTNKAKSVNGKFESRDRRRPLYVEKALGGRPTLRFDGEDDILRDAHFGRTAKNWTLVAVVTPRSNKGNGQFHGIFSANRRQNDDFTSGLNVDLGPVASTTFSELNFESSKDDPGAELRTEASKFGEGEILTLVTDATHTQLYVGLEAENMRFAGDAENSLEEVRLGGRFYFGGEHGFFDGDISEVLFYDTALSNSERVELTRYLSNKYDCASKKIEYSLEGAWVALKSYQGTGSRLALTPIDQAIRRSHRDAAQRKDIERRLLAVLQADAPAAAKEFAIRRLIYVGTEESVPALAAELADPRLGFLAQITLQAIPGEASAAAIRQAVEKSPPGRQLGLIQGLGLLRDRKAIPLLASLSESSNNEVASAAAEALAQIGDPDCIAPLDKFLQKAGSAQKSVAFAVNLLLAARLRGQNHPAESMKIYRSLEPLADDAGHCAILAGLVEAQPEQAASLLLSALADKSPRIRGEAAGLIRTTKRGEILAELAKHFGELPREGQLLFLDAVAHRDRELVTLIARKAWQSKDAEIRAAALSLFGVTGDELDVPELVRASAAAKSAVEKEAAFRSLAQLHGEGVDAALISQLKQTDAVIRAVAVRALAARQCPAAFEEFVKAAKDSDAAVRAEAGKALQALASERAAGRLVQLLLGASDDAQRSMFEGALIASCRKIAAADKRAAPILAEYARADERAKGVLLPVLGALGGKPAHELIDAAVGDPTSKLYEPGVRALANWPDAGVVAELLTLAKSDTDPTHRSWLVRGIARVAPRPGQLPPQEAFAAMQKAFELADRLEDKQLVLTRMSAIRTPDCLAFAVAKIDDAELQAVAIITTVKLAEAMRESHPRKRKRRSNAH